MPASTSATPWASDPASAAGLVAPAWPADSSRIGMPRSTPASRQRLASSPKRKGGTTWQQDIETNGRAAKPPSAPAIMSNMSTLRCTACGVVKLVPRCLAVPASEA